MLLLRRYANISQQSNVANLSVSADVETFQKGAVATWLPAPGGADAPFCRLRDRTSAKIATLFSCVLLRSPAAELPPNDKTKVSSVPNVKVLLLFFLQKVGQRTSRFGAILLISDCSSIKNKRTIRKNDTLIFICLMKQGESPDAGPAYLFLMAACAAARRAMGTRKGEQLT